MSSLLTLATLFAEGGYQHLGRRFRRGSGGLDSIEFILLVGILVLIGVAVVVLSRYLNGRDERGFESPRALFSELCRVHELNWTSRRVLTRLANHHQIHPSQLFVEPGRFAAEHTGAALAPYAAEIATLKQQLFGEETTDASV